MSFTASLDDIISENANGLLGDGGGRWPRVPLGHVARIQNGFPFPSAQFDRERGVPLIRIRDIDSDTTEVRFLGPYDETFVVCAGDLLVGMDGDFRAHTWRGPRGLLNQRVCRVSPLNGAVEMRYLAHILPGYLAAINAKTSSITVKHLSSKTISAIPLPLPPIAEQRLVAAMLDERLSELDAAAAGLTRAQANARRHRVAVLDDALRQAESHPECRRETLKALAVSSGYGISQKCLYRPGGVPVLRIPNVVDGRISLDGLKMATDPTALNASDMLAPGDLLVVRTNGSRNLIGRGAVLLEALPSSTAFASYLIRYRLRNAPWLWRWMRTIWNAPRVRSELESMAASSAGQFNLSVSKLDRVEIPVPPQSMADSLVKDAELRLLMSDRAEATLSIQLARAAQLRRAIMRAAFDGTLISNGVSDADTGPAQVRSRPAVRPREMSKRKSARRPR